MTGRAIFGGVADPARPDCSAAEVLDRAQSAGTLPRFSAEFGQPSTDGKGDCHEVALALMVDLVTAGRADGWRLVSADVHFSDAIGPIRHSWLEYDGWAVDAANGAQRGGRVLVMVAREYRTRARSVARLVSRTGRQLRRELTSGRFTP